jgi:hypothetical protein
MNQTLEKALSRALGLPKGEQDRLAMVIDEFTLQSKAHDALVADLEEPEYRSYVALALDKGRADIAAGKYAPVGDALSAMKMAMEKRAA